MKDGLGFKRETTFQDEQAAHPQNSVSPDRATSRERGGRLVRVPNLYFGSTIQYSWRTWLWWWWWCGCWWVLPKSTHRVKNVPEVVVKVVSSVSPESVEKCVRDAFKTKTTKSHFGGGWVGPPTWEEFPRFTYSLFEKHPSCNLTAAAVLPKSFHHR